MPSGDTNLTFQRLLDCPSGTFEYDPRTNAFTWSDELFRIHGYERGEVVPTLELGLAHVHGADREATKTRWAQLTAHGGRYTNYHTIVDAAGREHRVLSVVETSTDRGDRTIRGVITDLTLVFDKESRTVANEAVAQSALHRASIEQAKGVLMAHFTTNADTAFDILVRLSSVSNRRLNEVVDDFMSTVSSRGMRTAIELFFPPSRRVDGGTAGGGELAVAAAGKS